MRKKNLAVIAAVVTTAAAASWFVVRQFPREGEVSPLVAAPAPAAPPAAPPTPSLDPPATAADGFLEVGVTAGGEPVRGAEVRLYLEAPETGPTGTPFLRAGRGETGRDGLARLPARPGSYLVAARAPGFAPARVEVTRPRGEAATRTEVALAPAVSLEGRAVARADGKPLPARITVGPAARRDLALAPPSAPPEEEAAATSDPSGVFRIDGLAPGLHAVTVEAEGHHPAVLPSVVLPRAEPLVVALDGLGRVAGTVLLPDGKPAAGARVLVASAEHEGRGTSGADGRFAVAVPAGTYRVLATLDGRGGAAAPVSVAAGGAAPDVSVRLGPAAAVEGVAVQAAGGAPVAGAEVALLPHETGAVAASGRAGRDGRFRLDGLAPGPYDLRAAARGRSPAVVVGITVGAGQRFPVTAALAGTGAVEGVVRSAAGAPLASVRVRAEARGDGLAGAAPVEARTDFEGRYRIDGLEVGRAELVAHEQAAALGVSRAVRIAEGRTARVDFFLPESGILAGRASPPPGRPPGPLAVVAVPMRGGLGGPQAARTLADASGNYRFDLPAGEYRVYAAPADALRTDLRVAPDFASVPAGRSVRLDLVAAAPAEERGLEILVVEPGGAPSAGAVVTIARAGDDRIALATTAGEDGRVGLSDAMGLAGRKVLVRARNGGRAGAFTGTLEPGATAVVSLGRGAAVEGAVRSRGARVDGFTLEVASEPAPGAWRTLDVHRFAGDRFELGDLPADPVRLTVQTADGRRGAASLVLAPGEARTVAIDVEGPGTRASR